MTARPWIPACPMTRHPQLAALPQLTFADVAAELQREGEQRARVYPDRVAKGMMQAAEADYQIAIWAAIGVDLAADMQLPGSDAYDSHKFSHAQRVTALQRELDMRRQYYPGWVGKSRMTQAQADHRTAAIGAMLYRYQCGYAWRGANGRRWYQDDVTPTKADRAEWKAYWAAVSPAIFSEAGGQANLAL